jgi:DMSO/TMAO reductase YedYZ molybdopterin-dependent catalytic subunit
MGFFDRNRKELAQRGIDPSRLPPGQYFTDRFPVLHAGSVPDYGDMATNGWDFSIAGLVEEPVTLTWAQLQALPSVEITTDIHCVTKWSKFDTVWKGLAVDTVLDLVEVRDEATHLMCHSEFGFTANLPLEDVLGVEVVQGREQPKALLAYEYAGQPLEPDHGYPLRFLVPHLYFWKSAKWLRGLELMAGDRPGFWERNGYHLYGDPFKEQRHWGD